jgi:hypothetical protein
MLSGRFTAPSRRARNPRSSRPRSAVGDLGPDHYARLAAGARLTQVLTMQTIGDLQKRYGSTK